MTRRAKVASVIAGVVVGLAVFIGVDQLTPEPKAVDVCVTVYEDANQQGDHHPFCAVGATNVHIANLGAYNTPLVNGCNRGLNQSSTYNDCISSATVGLLPANTKVQFWRDINYLGGLLACYDVDGTHGIDLSGTSDLISSFRIVGGNC